MTEKQPHPLRCETCKYKGATVHGKIWEEISKHVCRIEGQHDLLLTHAKLNIIKQRGCASHSDAVEQKIIKSSSSAKSDAVLDIEVGEWLYYPIPYVEYKDRECRIIKNIKDANEVVMTESNLLTTLF